MVDWDLQPTVQGSLLHPRSAQPCDLGAASPFAPLDSGWLSFPALGAAQVHPGEDGCAPRMGALFFPEQAPL